MRFWVNGEEQGRIWPDDRGFAYGDGVFETLAVRAGKASLWDAHLARLRHGAVRLGLPVPDEAALAQEAQTAMAGVGRGVLKLIWTRGRGARGYAPPVASEATRVVVLLPWPVQPPTAARDGVAVWPCLHAWSVARSRAGLKVLAALDPVQARSEVREPYAEGLMRDPSGDVISGTSSNVFVRIGSTLWTPALDHCGVAGVMRGAVLEALTALGHRVEVGRIPFERLWTQGDEIFLTSSLIGVWPVARLAERQWKVGGLPGQIRAWLAAKGVITHGEETS